MPNILSSSGLQTVDHAEIVNGLKNSLKSIYGNDINLEADTPDGQLINIFAQAILDNAELIKQVYNSFNPDYAVGRVLDQRVGINGIQRQGGTYTTTLVRVNTTQPVTLYGLNQDTVDVYTVSDNAGTEWKLMSTVNLPSAGAHDLMFRAKNPGKVLTTPNTIDTPATIILGVSSVSNPFPYASLGTDEESDFDLRIRRQRSVSIPSQGYLEGLVAALENVTGVSGASVYENVSGLTDIDGVPAHTIWVVISGAPDPAEVAEVIYRKRNAGCNMFGAETYNVPQVDGSEFTVKWDYVISENLYIKFDVSPLDGINAPDITALKNAIAEELTPGVYERLDVNQLATLVRGIDSNALVTNAAFSKTGAGPWSVSIRPTARNFKFATLAANINITAV